MDKQLWTIPSLTQLEAVLEKRLAKSNEQTKPLFSRSAQKSFAEKAAERPQHSDKNKNDIEH